MFHLYGFFIGLGIVVAVWLTKKINSRWQILEGQFSLDDFLPWGLISGIMGARLYHVIDYWTYYQNNPWQIFFLWQGGLGIYGGLIGSVFGLWGFFKIKRIPNFTLTFLTSLDLMAFGLPLGQAIGRLGNYFNHELYGLPTKLPWGIEGGYHPLFAYEAIWSLIVFVILIMVIKVGKKRKPGMFFFLYLAFYGFGRFWLEFLRIEPWRLTGIAVAQILSLLCLLASLCYYKLVWKKN